MRAWVLAALIGASPLAAIAADVSVPARARGDAPERPPLSVWRFGEGRMAEHRQSGLRCPEQVAGATRANTHVYDSYGLDVSCGYNAPGVVVTMYLTRGLDAEVSMAGAKLSLADAWKARNPRLVREETVEQDGVTWRKAAYELDGAQRSDIWIAAEHGWALKFRATYDARRSDEVERQLSALAQTARESAGARLALCARSSPPARRGRLVKRPRSDDPMTLASLLGGAAAAAASEDGKPSAPPQAVTYCVEDPVPSRPMLVWRGVLPDGASADSDMVSVMTVGLTPDLSLAPDAIGDLLAADSRGRPRGRWIATMDENGSVQIYGYFDGRPRPEAAAELMAGIMSGEVEPLGGYRRNGKDIEVSLPAR